MASRWLWRDSNQASRVRHEDHEDNEGNEEHEEEDNRGRRAVDLTAASGGPGDAGQSDRRRLVLAQSLSSSSRSS
jgi:hypothetical protein